LKWFSNIILESLMSTKTRSIIIQLLSQLGSSREAREYLKRFSSVDTAQFAVIKVGGEIIRSQLKELCGALAFLHEVGLIPIVIHGAGPQLNEALNEAKIQTRVIDGQRVTTPEAMAVIRPVIYRENLRIVDALDDLGIRARSIQHGVFECEYDNQEKLGLVGRVTEVHLDAIKSAIESQAVPVVSCLGETAAGQVLNVNADTAAKAIILAIRPQKIVFLTPTGGLLDQSGQIISAINLATEYDELMSAPWVHSGMRLKLQEIKSILDQLPSSSSVSITSAEHLTRELFTYGGAGTLIRDGETFHEVSNLDTLNRQQLHALIETCFGRELDDAYFDQLKLNRVIWSETKRAAAVIAQGVDGVPYLDKFVVTPEAQGEGLGAALWHVIRNHYPQLYWRSRETNPINTWYLKQSDGVLRRPPWLIFHYGLTDFDTIERCTQDAFGRRQFLTTELQHA
jgi:acetylglutamate kinase